VIGSASWKDVLEMECADKLGFFDDGRLEERDPAGLVGHETVGERSADIDAGLK